MLRSIRLTIKATCNMNLANFPMDDQLCTVEIESFGYTMADLRYSTPQMFYKLSIKYLCSDTSGATV